jgi:glycosyltransferase involved in cell wall biosynthesis
MKDKVEASPMFQGKTVNMIPFGINQSIFRPLNKKRARKLLGVDENAIVIAFRSDPSPFKGLDKIEYALRNLRTNQKIVLLVLANKLRENPRGYDAREYGWVKDDNLLAKIYSAADVFLMPSEVESFGMMAIEAMSCGTVPIVTDGTALPGIINAPVSGVTTKNKNASYLAGVQHLLDDGDERSKRALSCQKYAREHFDKADYINKVSALYLEAIRNMFRTEEADEIIRQLGKYASKYNDTQAGTQGRNTYIQTIVVWALPYAHRVKNIFPKIIRERVFAFMSKHSIKQPN